MLPNYVHVVDVPDKVASMCHLMAFPLGLAAVEFSQVAIKQKTETHKYKVSKYHDGF